MLSVMVNVQATFTRKTESPFLRLCHIPTLQVPTCETTSTTLCTNSLGRRPQETRSSVQVRATSPTPSVPPPARPVLVPGPITSCRRPDRSEARSFSPRRKLLRRTATRLETSQRRSPSVQQKRQVRRRNESRIPLGILSPKPRHLSPTASTCYFLSTRSSNQCQRSNRKRAIRLWLLRGSCETPRHSR